MTSDKLTDAVLGITERAQVKAAFGEPQSFGERTLINVAKVMYGFGAGFGRGETGPEGADMRPSGEGGGGGGWARVMPIGTLEITKDAVRFINTMDSGKIAIVALVMVAWNVFWIARTIRVGLKRRQAGT